MSEETIKGIFKTVIFVGFVIGMLHLSSDHLNQNKHERELIRLELENQLRRSTKDLDNEWLDRFEKAKNCKSY